MNRTSDNYKHIRRKLYVVFLIFASLAFVAAPVAAEKLTKVAVIDLTSIVSDYFSESTQWREIDELTGQTEETINERKEEITSLKQQKVEAEDDGDELLVLKLDEQIRQKQEYLQEYHKIMSDRIQTKKDKLLSGSDFSKEIINAVQYIAESEGYSLVFRKKDPNILYFSYEVDITNKVLERLRRTAASR